MKIQNNITVTNSGADSMVITSEITQNTNYNSSIMPSHGGTDINSFQKS